MQENKKTEKRTINNFLVNNLLLVAGGAMTGSGLILQIGFHLGEHPVEAQAQQLRVIDTSKIVWGFNYPDWSSIHKIAIVFFTLIMIFHLSLHWKWYKGVITKHLMGKNRPVIILSVLFLLSTVTGFIPWMIDLSDGGGSLRMLFIEIHDKITLLLIIFLFLHVIKRAKWFGTAYGRLSKG